MSNFPQTSNSPGRLLMVSVDGGWSKWTLSACSVTCGGGTLDKYRICNNPLPANDGTNCSGSSTITEPCNVNLCPGWWFINYIM